MAKSIPQEFVKGLWAEVPPFRLVLGLCPVLAVTTTVENGIGMGLATTFVLVCSNVLVSLMRKIIPSKVRIPCFIVVIATFVTIVKMMMQAYAYPLYEGLGIFIPLIVVNCIVLGRSEGFAYKNPVLPSLADGLGMGIGFTLSLASLAAVREILGNGTFTLGAIVGDRLASLGIGRASLWQNPIHLFPASFEPFTFLVEPPGAFVSLGLMLCLMNLIGRK